MRSGLPCVTRFGRPLGRSLKHVVGEYSAKPFVRALAYISTEPATNARERGELPMLSVRCVCAEKVLLE